MMQSEKTPKRKSNVLIYAVIGVVVLAFVFVFAANRDAERSNSGASDYDKRMSELRRSIDQPEQSDAPR